jgi:hypothetical protein
MSDALRHRNSLRDKQEGFMKSRFTARRVVIGAVLAAALAGAATSAASGGTILIGSIAGTSTNAGA